MNVIYTDRLSKHFGSLKAVDQVSISVRQGEIMGLLGANGAGKTTLIKMLCGMLPPTEGTGAVAGYDIVGQATSIRHRIGYMNQSVSLLENLRVSENIEFYGKIYGMNKREIAARWEELEDLFKMGAHRHKLASELSSGWRQMLAFVIAVFHNPKTLFLDEPTSGLDPLSRFEMWEQIYRTAYQGTTIIMSTHYLSEAWYCDRLIMMENGRVTAEGSPEHLNEISGKQGLGQLFLMQQK